MQGAPIAPGFVPALGTDFPQLVPKGKNCGTKKVIRMLPGMLPDRYFFGEDASSHYSGPMGDIHKSERLVAQGACLKP